MTSKALYIGKFLVSGNDIVDGAVTFAELGTIYTSNLTEHVNLFFTNARARAAITVSGSGSYDENTGTITVTGGVTSVNGATGTVVLSTANIAESGNLYFSNDRVWSNVMTSISTTFVPEGTNLYFSNARSRAAITAGNTLVYAEATGNISLGLSGVTAGTYGGATQAAALIVDKFGRVTSASNVAISGGSGSPGGSSGQIQYNSSGAFAGSANLVWDNTNARLGIGTTTPAVKLEIFGTGEVLRLDSAAGQSKSLYFRNIGSTGTAKILADGTLTIETNSTYPITFSTQSTEKARITTAGELLIGATTNAGSAKTVIAGASGQAFEFFPGIATSTNTLQHYNRSTSAYMTSKAVALDYIFETSGNEALRITSARQIGIFGSPTATGGTTAGQLTINRAGISDALTDVNYALYIPLSNGGGGANSGSGDYGGIHIRCTSAPNYVPVYGIKSQIVSLVGTGQINYAGWFYAHSGDSGAQSTGVYAQSNSAGHTGLYSTIYAVRAYASSTSDGTTHSNYAGYFYNDGKTNNYVLSLADQYASAATRNIVSIVRNSTTVGTITTTLSATAYNTNSDYRLKSNVTPMSNALSDVMALNPVRFNWNNTNEAGLGFIAHELQAIVPEAVTGTKDAVKTTAKRDADNNIIKDQDGNIILEDQPVYQSVDTSFLVAHLVAAVQELKAMIDAQATEIAALKGN